jgi:hypothetical protein
MDIDSTMDRITVEDEVNQIRLALYDETKDMTAAEHTRWSNEQGQRLAAQYGFKIGTPSSAVKEVNLIS